MKVGLSGNIVIYTAFESDQGSGTQVLRIFQIFTGAKNTGSR
jgi:hypothetical protein